MSAYAHYAQENIFMTAKSVQTRTEEEILQLFQEKRSKPQCSENHNKHQNWKNQRFMAIKPKKWSKKLPQSQNWKSQYHLYY